MYIQCLYSVPMYRPRHESEFFFNRIFLRLFYRYSMKRIGQAKWRRFLVATNRKKSQATKLAKLSTSNGCCLKSRWRSEDEEFHGFEARDLWDLRNPYNFLLARDGLSVYHSLKVNPVKFYTSELYH